MSEFQRILDAIRKAAADLPEFTTDDVWPLLDFVPSERNTVGKGFSESARQGVIVGTERFIKSTRKEAKGRRVQVWRGVVR